MKDKEKIRVEIAITCENKDTYESIMRLLNSFPMVTNLQHKIVNYPTWIPKKGDVYWCPVHDTFEGCMFRNEDIVWNDDEADHLILQKGWVFRTAEESQLLCEKLNRVIECIKP